MLVWRGMGIAIPIIFVLSGLIYSWISGDPDGRLGNPTMLGWASLATGILSLLLGLVAFGGDDKDAQGNPLPKKKHDFFWIPMWIWGVALIGLSIYMLAFAGKKDADTATTSTPTEVPADVKPAPPTTRLVNFYNPTQDTMSFIIADESKDGLIEQAYVDPMSYAQRELEEGSYFFAGYDSKSKTTLILNSKEFVYDSTKYTLIPGEDGPTIQRIITPMTPATDDYDEAWLILDGKTKFLLVDVTIAADSNVTRGDVRDAKWAERIVAEYTPLDLIEPTLAKDKAAKNTKLFGPGDALPFQRAADEVDYLLVPYKGEKDKRAVIAKFVERTCFPE